MASPVGVIPALPPHPRSTEDRLTDINIKIDWLVDQLTDLLATTHRIAARLDATVTDITRRTEQWTA